MICIRGHFYFWPRHCELLPGIGITWVDELEIDFEWLRWSWGVTIWREPGRPAND